MRRILAIVIAAVAVASLAGCGKAGRPVQPPGSNYPRVYPDPALGPTSAQQKEGRAAPPEWDQQDLKDRFTPGGAYIDPSTKVVPGNQVLPASNLPNSTQTQSSSDIFSKGLAPTQSPLPPVQPSGPTEEEQPQQ